MFSSYGNSEELHFVFDVLQFHYDMSGFCFALSFGYLSWYLWSLSLKIPILLFLELMLINSGKLTVIALSIFSLPFSLFFHVANLMLAFLILLSASVT